MAPSPRRKSIREMTEGELREMADNLAQRVQWSFGDVIGELTYREQRRLARWVAVFIAGSLAANIAAIVLNAVL